MKTSPFTKRTIKVEISGDYFRKATFPKIRLQGKWLEAIGFKPSGHVVIRSKTAGELVLKFISPHRPKHCSR